LQYRRLRHDGAGEQGGGVGVITDVLNQRVQQGTIKRCDLFAQRRRRGEAIAQGGQVAWPCRTQRDSGEDAFQVSNATKLLAQRFAAPAIDQRADRLMATTQQLA